MIFVRVFCHGQRTLIPQFLPSTTFVRRRFSCYQDVGKVERPHLFDWGQTIGPSWVVNDRSTFACHGNILWDSIWVRLLSHVPLQTLRHRKKRGHRLCSVPVLVLAAFVWSAEVGLFSLAGGLVAVATNLWRSVAVQFGPRLTFVFPPIWHVFWGRSACFLVAFLPCGYSSGGGDQHSSVPSPLVFEEDCADAPRIRRMLRDTLLGS